MAGYLRPGKVVTESGESVIRYQLGQRDKRILQKEYDLIKNLVAEAENQQARERVVKSKRGKMSIRSGSNSYNVQMQLYVI